MIERAADGGPERRIRPDRQSSLRQAPKRIVVFAMIARRGSPYLWVAALAGSVCLSSLEACGGGTPSAKTGDKARGSDGSDYEGDETVPDSYCLDGTCFDCGESFCMLGWYCDESMDGGPGCSFVPECGSESNCGCVESALTSACSCEERNGGVYVSCE